MMAGCYFLCAALCSVCNVTVSQRGKASTRLSCLNIKPTHINMLSARRLLSEDNAAILPDNTALHISPHPAPPIHFADRRYPHLI